MTLAEFLEWEERQPLRYEFDGVGPVAMTGGDGEARRGGGWASTFAKSGLDVADRVIKRREARNRGRSGRGA